MEASVALLCLSSLLPLHLCRWGSLWSPGLYPHLAVLLPHSQGLPGLVTSSAGCWRVPFSPERPPRESSLCTGRDSGTWLHRQDVHTRLLQWRWEEQGMGVGSVPVASTCFLTQGDFRISCNEGHKERSTFHCI